MSYRIFRPVVLACCARVVLLHALVAPALAFTIDPITPHQPVAGSTLNVSWSTQPGDPALFRIRLANEGPVKAGYAVVLAIGVESAGLTHGVKLPANQSGPNYVFEFFNATNPSDVYASSSLFTIATASNATSSSSSISTSPTSSSPQSPPSSSSSSSSHQTLPVALGVSIPLVVVLLLTVGILLLHRQRRRNNAYAAPEIDLEKLPDSQIQPSQTALLDDGHYSPPLPLLPLTSTTASSLPREKNSEQRRYRAQPSHSTAASTSQLVSTARIPSSPSSVTSGIRSNPAAPSVSDAPAAPSDPPQGRAALQSRIASTLQQLDALRAQERGLHGAGGGGGGQALLPRNGDESPSTAGATVAGFPLSSVGLADEKRGALSRGATGAARRGDDEGEGGGGGGQSVSETEALRGEVLRLQEELQDAQALLLEYPDGAGARVMDVPPPEYEQNARTGERTVGE